MSVCDGSDNEDFDVKQEPMDSHKMKSEEYPPGLESGDPHNDSKLADAQLKTGTSSGKLYLTELGI